MTVIKEKKEYVHEYKSACACGYSKDDRTGAYTLWAKDNDSDHYFNRETDVCKLTCDSQTWEKLSVTAINRILTWAKDHTSPWGTIGVIRVNGRRESVEDVNVRTWDDPIFMIPWPKHVDSHLSRKPLFECE